MAIDIVDEQSAYQRREASKQKGRAKANAVPRNLYNASYHVSPTCVACDGDAPCGQPSVEGQNCCYDHLAAGDRRRIERELEPPPPKPNWRNEARRRL